MIRGPGARSSAAWLRRAARLFADNQRLLLFACAIRVLEAAVVLPLTIVGRDALHADDLARDASDLPSRTVHLLGLGPGAATVVAIVGVWLATVVVDAWLRGALIASFRSARLTLRPPAGAFLALLVVYGATDAAGLGVVALARDDSLRGLALPATVLVAVPTLYADYAIVLDRVGPLASLVASLRTARRAALATFLVFVAALVVGQVETSVFVDPLANATHLLPGFVIGLLLADAVRQFALDCSLIAAYKPYLTRDEEPEAHA